ncbi:MAG TPA: hypothetical protein VF303_02770 [Candidatus Nanoarchaeia archaeon]
MGEILTYTSSESTKDGVQAAIIDAHKHWDDLRNKALEDELPLREIVRRIVSKAQTFDPNVRWRLRLSEYGDYWELSLISNRIRGVVQGQLEAVANNFTGNLHLILNLPGLDEESREE